MYSEMDFIQGKGIFIQLQKSLFLLNASQNGRIAVWQVKSVLNIKESNYIEKKRVKFFTFAFGEG